jgi:hypothetical protein
MKLSLTFFVALALISPALAAAPAERAAYPWLERYDPADSLAARIAPPAGLERAAAAPGSFESWLRGLPLKKGNPPVRLYNGQEKPNQTAHWAVLDLDTGPRDLQQCADSVIRLRAEYLYAAGKFDEIHFNFTSGDRADFSRWLAGFTPTVRGNKVEWVPGRPRPDTRAAFRAYLDVVFTYAGTASLAKELKPVPDVRQMRAGDVFIQGGSPGHVVIVVDMAADPAGGRKAFLLAQGFMPAQDMHILRNPASSSGPWYDLDFGQTLRTPEWTFAAGDLRRF